MGSLSGDNSIKVASKYLKSYFKRNSITAEGKVNINNNILLNN